VWIGPKHHKIVGAHLAALRHEIDITQADLAKRLRKAQSFVSAFENGQRRVDLLEFASIVLALGGDPQAVSTKIFAAIEQSSGVRRAKPRS